MKSGQRTNYISRLINFVPTQKEFGTASKNMGLILSTLKHFKGLLEDHDLKQAGFLGLVKAAHVYDASKGSFSNCAILWIRQAMRYEIEISGRTVIIPLLTINRLYKIQGAQSRFRSNFHREPTIKEIAEVLLLKEYQVKEALSLVNNTTSLNTPDGERDDERIDQLIDPETVETEDNEIFLVMRDALKSLKTIEQTVLVESIIKKKPAAEIGAIVGFERNCVGKIKAKALASMREKIRFAINKN